MSSNSRDLDVLLDTQSSWDSAPNGTEKVVTEMKSSLIFQYNWEELLQTVPTALSYVGAVFVASGSAKATRPLRPMHGKEFRYLKHSTVQANLVECGNLGHHAFLNATKDMESIGSASRSINRKLDDTAAILGDPTSARKLLGVQLANVKKSAEQCLLSSKSMDNKFEQWLLYVCEMHAACVQQENNTRDALLSNELCLAAENARLDTRSTFSEEARKVSETFVQHVQIAAEAYRTALDEFPPGWDLMGQQVVRDLMGGVACAMDAAIPALFEYLSPMAESKAGGNIVGSFLSANTRGSTAGIEQVPATAIPRLASDPAYAGAIMVHTYISALHVIVNGKDGNVDWKLAREDASKDGTRSGIKFIAAMLRDATSRFSRVATAAEPSQLLKTVLRVSSQIADEISSEVGEARSISRRAPEKDSQTVRDWQYRFGSQYETLNRLVAQARAIPGNSANGIPLAQPIDPPMQMAETDAEKAQAQAVLESAKKRLTGTQQILSNSQNQYINTTKLLAERQNKLEGIQLHLDRLIASDPSLTEIKSTLAECIKLIIVLKQQISNLVRFYGAVSATIDLSLRHLVDPFIKTIRSSADNEDYSNNERRVGAYALIDYQRSQVFGALVTMRSHFEVFEGVAKTWTELAPETIMPGIKMCSDLARFANEDREQSDEMLKTVSHLAGWSKTASDRVATVARKRQASVIDDMSESVNEARDTAQSIAPLPSVTLRAITAGTNAIRDAAILSSQKRLEASPLVRFDLRNNEY